MDGRTSAPDAYTGPVGSKLPGCEKLLVVEYAPMPWDLLEFDPSRVSTDQSCLLDISRAVASGVRSDDL